MAHSYNAALYRQLLVAVPIAYLLVLFIYPVASMLGYSFGIDEFTTSYYWTIVTTPGYRNVLYNTIYLAVTTSFLCLLVGYPIAMVMLRASPLLKSIIIILIIIPFWTSALVRAIAWLAILGRNGVVNTTLLNLNLVSEPLPMTFNAFGMYLGTVHFMLPYMIFCLYNGMKRIDQRTLNAAKSLGASPSRAFLFVFLPLSSPGITAGLLLVFLLSLGFYVTPAVLGGARDTTFVLLIDRMMNTVGNWPLAAAAATILLLVTFVIYFVMGKYLGFSSLGLHDSRAREFRYRSFNVYSVLYFVHRILGPAWRQAPASGGRAIGARQRTLPPGAEVGLKLLNRLLKWTGIAACIAFLIAPIGIVVFLSFGDSITMAFPPEGYSLRWFESYFSRADWLSATITSAVVAVIAMVLSTLVAVVGAIWIAGIQGWMRNVVLAGALSPLVIPSVVYAVAIYLVFAKVGMNGTKLGIGLAHSIIVFPLPLIAILSSMQSLDPMLRKAAASLGGGPVSVFLRITLPLIMSGILTGATLAFLTSFDELVVAMFLSGTGAITLPRKLFESVSMDTDPTMLAASTILVCLTILAIVVTGLITRSALRLGGHASR